jgi:uncharacterized protein
MKHYLFKLIPPRPTFPADMTPTEGKLMQEHVAYWTELMNQGRVIVFGPVADPQGTYGIGVLRLEDDADAQALGANDPTIKADAGFKIEIHPMPRAVVPAT